MADAAAFNFVCDQIEALSSLDRLEARGTVRFALKAAGLDASNVQPSQMQVVLEKLLPAELATRGVQDGAEICQRLVSDVIGIDPGQKRRDEPDAIFSRLGGGRV